MGAVAGPPGCTVRYYVPGGLSIACVHYAGHDCPHRGYVPSTAFEWRTNDGHLTDGTDIDQYVNKAALG